MPGMLSSGAKRRLPNYKVCNNYHCPMHVSPQGKPTRRSATWRNCYRASHYYQLFLLCLKALTMLSAVQELINLQPLNCLETLGESASSLGDSTTGVWVHQGTTKGNGRGGGGNGRGERRHPGEGGLLLSEEGSPERDRARAALKSRSEQS